MEITRSWSYLNNIGEDVKGRVSSSGYGIHLRAERASDTKLAEAERRIAGDDSKRIALDIERDYRPPQVLFDLKEDKHAGPWVESLDSLIRLYRDSTGYTF